MRKPGLRRVDQRVTRGTIWAHHIWSRARLARECNRRCRLSRKIKSGPLILIS
jgi:hypothetical protein